MSQTPGSSRACSHSLICGGLAEGSCERSPTEAPCRPERDLYSLFLRAGVEKQDLPSEQWVWRQMVAALEINWGVYQLPWGPAIHQGQELPGSLAQGGCYYDQILGCFDKSHPCHISKPWKVTDTQSGQHAIDVIF